MDRVGVVISCSIVLFELYIAAQRVSVEDKIFKDWPVALHFASRVYPLKRLLVITREPYFSFSCFQIESIILVVSFAAVIRVVTRHATLLPSKWGGALRDE